MTRDEFILQAYLAAIASGKDMADSEHIADESADFYDRICVESKPQSFWRTFETQPTALDGGERGLILCELCDVHRLDPNHRLSIYAYMSFVHRCPDCRWAPIPK